MNPHAMRTACSVKSSSRQRQRNAFSGIWPFKSSASLIVSGLKNINMDAGEVLASLVRNDFYKLNKNAVEKNDTISK